jgi:hypothetical protein
MCVCACVCVHMFARVYFTDPTVILNCESSRVCVERGCVGGGTTLDVRNKTARRAPGGWADCSRFNRVQPRQCGESVPQAIFDQAAWHCKKCGSKSAADIRRVRARDDGRLWTTGCGQHAAHLRIKMPPPKQPVRLLDRHARQGRTAVGSEPHRTSGPLFKNLYRVMQEGGECLLIIPCAH